MTELNAAAPDKQFFLYYVPGGTHAPHQPTPEWIKKISDMHLFDKGWNDLREQKAEYRYINFDYRANRTRTFVVNTTMSGVVVGLTYAFD